MAELVRVGGTGRSLLITSILAFANATLYSRCYEEADLLLQAKHLFLCGKTASTEDSADILALCLATSSVRGDPHEIHVKLVAGDDAFKFRVGSASCSCVAGPSECCKHVVAVLLHCNRTGIHALEDLSCTDKECSWRKAPGKALYGEPVPVKAFCHVRMLPAPLECSTQEKGEILKLLTGACYNSALAKHRRRRRAEQSCSAPEPPSLDERYRHIIQCCEGSNVLARLAEIPACLPEGCSSFYEKEVVVPVDVATVMLHDTRDNKAAWMLQRRCRVTGTTCYPLYTYKLGDWNKKVPSLMQPSFRGNASTAYGQRCEPKARKKYETESQVEVFTCGLLVSPKNPWLGCSPDGVVFEGGRPTKLVEIKCPTKGQTVTAKAVLAACDFLDCDEAGNYMPKQRHTYYAQMQLGMVLLDVRKCDMVIYADKDESIEVISVDFDEAFTLPLLTKVKDLYFTHVLPILCSTADV
ncbi:uncharacterized protein ISCGN_017730 [Ixodes scapularis]